MLDLYGIILQGVGEGSGAQISLLTEINILLVRCFKSVAKLYSRPAYFRRIITGIKLNHLVSIGVPRPLINDLWVFLFQTIDSECIT